MTTYTIENMTFKTDGKQVFEQVFGNWQAIKEQVIINMYLDLAYQHDTDTNKRGYCNKTSVFKGKRCL